MRKVQAALASEDIFPRRYFYPSLDTLDFLESTDVCPVSRDVASRILCLPIFSELEESRCRMICRIVADTLN